jgi:glycine cleavage system H lipoate-binding protein
MGIIIDTQQEKQCIWVAAGVLSYKLCDRGFRCEHCPLDAALRDSDASCHEEAADLEIRNVALPEKDEIPDSITPLLAPFLSVPVCQNAQYSAHHIWVRALPSGMLQCGLDAFAANLLPSEAQIVVVANNTELREGENFGWVYGGSHAIPLSAPVSGTVVCRNNKLHTTDDGLRAAPYRQGVIVTIFPAAGALAHARLSSPRNHARRIRKRARLLTERLTRELASPAIGPCLNDGGEPVATLAQFLGDEKYWALLDQFIGGE